VLNTHLSYKVEVRGIPLALWNYMLLACVASEEDVLVRQGLQDVVLLLLLLVAFCWKWQQLRMKDDDWCGHECFCRDPAVGQASRA
jgi:hypothetical protein